MTTQMTPEESNYVDNMRHSSDVYVPYSKTDIDTLIAIIDRLDRAYDALRRGYYPGDPATEPAAEPIVLQSAAERTDASEAPFKVGQRVTSQYSDTDGIVTEVHPFNDSVDSGYDDMWFVWVDLDNGGKRKFVNHEIELIYDKPAPAPTAVRLSKYQLVIANRLNDG